MAKNEPIKNPESEDAFGGAESETGSVLHKQLEKYAKAKCRSSDMSDYIQSEYPSERKLADKLHDCGSFLVFRDYYRISELRLHRASFCKKHLLCPFCAIRRAMKAIAVYEERVQEVLKDNPKLKLYMVTLTVKNGESIDDRHAHLTNSKKKYTAARRRHINNPNRSAVEFNKALGGVYSIEHKRGKNSGLWHPHSHEIWICEDEPDKYRLSEEWQRITGDSKIVDVRPMTDGESRLKGFLEVFKYALKFSDMELSDNWTAYKAMNGKRLVNPFGVLRGLEIPEDLEDDPIEHEPYMELYYNYFRNAGYSLAKAEHHDFDPWTVTRDSYEEE
ncbi:MAG: protein rep [Candidatus Bathyarchaeales archaeon]